MESYQAHGSRQFHPYSSTSTASKSGKTSTSKAPSSTLPTGSSSLSTDNFQTSSRTHRRQKSEPTSLRQQIQPPSAGSSGAATTTTPTTTNIKPSSSSRSGTTADKSSNPSSHFSHTSQLKKSESGYSTSRQKEKLSTIPQSTNSSSLLSSSSSSSYHPYNKDGDDVASSQPRSSQSRSSSADKTRSKRNEYSTKGDKSTTSAASSRPSSRSSKSTNVSRSKSTEVEEHKPDPMRGSSTDGMYVSEKAGAGSSSRASTRAEIREDDSKEYSNSKSSRSSSSGKPSHTPKTKRRPRSSSKSRLAFTDEDGERRVQTSSRLVEHEVETPSQSSSFQDSASVSSRLLPENSSSSGSIGYDKITTKERDRRTSFTNGKDCVVDTRSTKSDKYKSKRATSAPRDNNIRSVNGREKLQESDDKKSHHGKGSISYHQLPKYDTSQKLSSSSSSSIHQKSVKKHNSLFDVSDNLEPNEEGISMKELGSSQLDKYNKSHRHSSHTSSSSSSIRNYTEPSTNQSRSTTQDSSSTRSPRNSSRKHSSYSSDVEIKSDSDRSTRGPSVSSAEEPLLPKVHIPNTRTHKKSSSDTRSDGKTHHTTTSIQTFPRMKNQNESPKKMAPVYPSATATIDRYQTGKTQFLLDRIRNFSTNQVTSEQDSYFSPLQKIPSQSSLSSDARSDVCLDLPDVAEDNEDYYNTLRNDLKIKTRFPVARYEPIPDVTQRNVCKSVIANLFRTFFSFLLFWPLVVTLVVLVPIMLIIKRLLSLCCCCCEFLWGRCCVCFCHTHLSSSELVWLGRTGTKNNPVVQSLIVVQRGLDTDRIRHLIDSRILFVENRRGRKLYPRFTQKIAPFCCGQAWVNDHSFVTSSHIYDMPGYIETLDDLQQFISKMASEPLSLRHPLWEIQVLHDFREPRDTVLLFRMHMCMTDGISMVHVLQNALVDSQKPSSKKTTFGDEAANTSTLKVLFTGPLTFLTRYVCRRNDFNLIHGGHFETSGENVVAWSEPFSLSAALRVKQVARCTLVDLLLSITAGNIRTYLQVCGVRNPYNITCAVPVDFQSLDSGALDMENKFSIVHIPLPTNTEGAIPRLWQVKHNMERFKGTAEAAIVNGTRWLMHSLLPVSCFQRLWQKVNSRCTLLVSNISGPTSVLKLDSREIKCMMYWVPPVDKVAVTVSFFTYADQIRMSVISDRSALPNPELLTRDFIYKLETISKLLAHRRIPGESSSSKRRENVHLLSSFTLDDLTADQIQLEMSLVQQELHDLKVQLDSGPSDHISHNDTQLMERIEALKERSSELMMQLRKRKSEETESAVILSEEADDLSSELDGQSRPFRRRTLSMSSRMSTASVSSTARPLSTASTPNLTSNLPSPTHHSLPSWPEGDLGMEEEMNEDSYGSRRSQRHHRFPQRPDPELDSPEHHHDYRNSNIYHNYSNPSQLYSSHHS